jgi:hypothetical protein
LLRGVGRVSAGRARLLTLRHACRGVPSVAREMPRMGRAPLPRGAGAAAVLACTLALGIGSASTTGAPAPTPIYSGVPIHEQLAPNETKCYHFGLDANTTREVVYWPMAKLHIRLTPCSGTPHLRASVHGCPSQGHLVNFEFQNTKSRNDMIAKNLTVPPMWEWVGDTETLSLDVTHRNFYIEVTQYHPPLRTNETKADLARRLRQAQFDKQAEVVNDMIFVGRFGRDEAVQLRALQELVMPVAQYELVAHLHDNKDFPDDKLTPLANTPGFKRDIEMVDPGQITESDPMFGAYIIAWHPPTWKPSANNSNSTDVNATSTSSDASPSASGGAAAMRSDADAALDDLPHHHRRLLAMHEGGAKDVTWGQVQELLGAEDWAVRELSAAHALLSPDDVIFYAHPGVANARRAAEPQVTGRQLHALKLADPTHPEHRKTVEEEARRLKALEETEERLAALASHPEYEEALQRAFVEVNPKP